MRFCSRRTLCSSLRKRSRYRNVFVGSVLSIFCSSLRHSALYLFFSPLDWIDSKKIFKANNPQNQFAPSQSAQHTTMIWLSDDQNQQTNTSQQRCCERQSFWWVEPPRIWPEKKTSVTDRRTEMCLFLWYTILDIYSYVCQIPKTPKVRITEKCKNPKPLLQYVLSIKVACTLSSQLATIGDKHISYIVMFIST